eukprot:scaffold224353_cov17-Prasinocladus_malaysianus.AAC.2
MLQNDDGKYGIIRPTLSAGVGTTHSSHDAAAVTYYNGTLHKILMDCLPSRLVADEHSSMPNSQRHGVSVEGDFPVPSAVR